MAGKPGALSLKPTELPAQYRQLFAWKLDRRSTAVREIAADLHELWTSLGGVEQLSPQQLWLCERVVFIRRRVLAYEAAVMHNAGLKPGEEQRPLPMDAGTYSNHANVLQGYLRTLGLERRSRPAGALQQYLAARTAAA
jgi:hypothetical protein